MSSFRIFFFIAFLVAIFSAQDFSSCSMMDSMGKVARSACITSCSVQNCGTGYCEKRGGRPTCVCSRCALGGNVPVDTIAGGIGAVVKG